MPDNLGRAVAAFQARNGLAASGSLDEATWERLLQASGAPVLGEAEITGSSFFGTHYRCHLAPVAANGVSLVAHLPQSARIETGERIALAVDPAGVTVLPAA